MFVACLVCILSQFGCFCFVRREVDHLVDTTTDDVVLDGLIANQLFPKFRRGTLTNESSHSVFNDKGIGKGWKSFDNLKVSNMFPKCFAYYLSCDTMSV